MPLYEYECKKCKTIIEVIQKLSEDNLTEVHCPSCESVQPCDKIISSMNFTLKGRCWASDGYSRTYEQTMDMV